MALRLLRDARVDPSANDNWAIKFALFNGQLAVVDQLLLTDTRVDPSIWDQYVIRNDPKTLFRKVIQQRCGALVWRMLRNAAIRSQLDADSFKLLTPYPSSGIAVPVFTAHIREKCQRAGLRADSAFCQGFISAMTRENPRSAPLLLLQQGHFDAALMSIDRYWKRLEWTIRHAQIRVRYHPRRMAEEIDGWVNESAGDYDGNE